MTTFKLRDYQKTALDVIDRDLAANDDPVLLQAVMGAGKTVQVTRLINKYWFTTSRRFLILAHKQELVQQFVKTFKNMTSIPVPEIGICCAGLNKKQLSQRLTIGTVQTFVNCLDKYNGCDLLVIDEAHRISIGTNSQYDQVINSLNQLRPNMRILGVTATPSRLGHGFIYDDKCRPPSKNLFPRLNHKIEYEELKAKGYLVHLKGVVAVNKHLKEDLSGVKTSGDYVLSELGAVMSRGRHIQTAVEAINQYTKGYRKVCVFCCTIDHAKQIHSMLGDDATIVHSQLSPIDRATNMETWRQGNKRIITSVNILIEGFDFPALDCLVLARPTLSSSLFLQAVGRVLRTHESKTHGMLVDLTTNTERFGTNLDNVKVVVPQSVEKIIKKEQELIKICPACEAEVHISRRICNCGYEWPAAECSIAKDLPNMEEVDFERTEPEWYEVTGMDVSIHESRKNGKQLGRVSLEYGNNFYRPQQISLYFCLLDYYEGYAIEKSQQRWTDISIDSFPETVEEFCTKKICQPIKILIDDNGEYPEIKDMEMAPF